MYHGNMRKEDKMTEREKMLAGEYTAFHPTNKIMLLLEQEVL